MKQAFAKRPLAIVGLTGERLDATLGRGRAVCKAGARQVSCWVSPGSGAEIICGSFLRRPLSFSRRNIYAGKRGRIKLSARSKGWAERKKLIEKAKGILMDSGR